MDVVTMPQLGETVTEGTITRWAVAVGDEVAVDDALFEVSTEKVDTEVPSAVGGVVRELLVAEGETVPVGAPVAVLTATADEPYEPPGTGPVPPADGEGAPPAERPDRADTGGPPPGDSGPPGAGAPAPARAGGGSTAAAPAPAPARSGGPRTGGDRPPALSPVVRRLLDEHHLDPAVVAGSGREGRITRADVLAAAAQRDRAPLGNGDRAAAPAAAHVTARTVAPAPAPAPPPVELHDGDEVVEFSRARQATAERMRRAVDTAAHALVSVQVDYTAVDAVRRGAGLTYLPFVARAVVEGLARFPHLNAVVDGDRLVVRRGVHLGVAVDLDREALVVPVLRDAERLRLRPLAAAIDDLADRARRRRLPGEAFGGGSFTLTNVGAFGTAFAAPIVNLPQVAILSVDGIAMAPVAVRVDGDPAARTEDRAWGVAVHPVGNLSLSFDHRAVDGAYAAAFLAEVRDALQSRRWDQEVGP